MTMTNTSKLYRCIISPGIAEILSNSRSIPGFFPAKFEQKEATATFSKSKVKIHFNIKKTTDIPTENYNFGNYGRLGTDSIIREYNLPLGIRAKIELKELNIVPQVNINKAYFRFGKIRINDYCSPGMHVRDILTVTLIRAGYVALHGAAFASNKDGILVLGLPGTGKTLVLLQAMREGYQYLADDFTIADDNRYIYPCLGISSINYELGTKQLFEWQGNLKQKLRVRELLLKNMKPMRYLASSPYIDIRQLFPDMEVAGKTHLRNVVILTKGDDCIKKLSKDEAYSMIVKINRIELSYFGNQMLQSYGLFNSWLNIREIMQSEEKRIMELVESSLCFLCSSSNPNNFFSLIQRST